MSDSQKSWSFSASARRRRRSLVPLGGLLGVVLISTALLGLFGVYYADKGHHRQMDRMQRLTDGLDTVRQAQIHFKKQVQEWKNVLLRGRDPQQLIRYRDAFEAEEGKTRKLLNTLAGADFGFSLPAGAVAGIMTAHDRLGEAYRKALQSSGANDGFDGDAIDTRVRGIDRPLDADLDGLADLIAGQVTVLNRDMQAESDTRYAAQQRLSTGALAVCVVLMGVFLVLAMREERAS